MLNQKTVLIVGAGASNEFDFPIGIGLVETIKNICKQTQDAVGRRIGHAQFAKVLATFAAINKIPQNDVFIAANQIAIRLEGSHKSIDQLIHAFSHQPTFVEVAKVAIAFAISERENKAFGNSLSLPWAQTPWKKDNWIDTFTSNYFAGFRRDDLKELFDDLVVICFNYDRCVEYGFCRALAFHLDLDDTTAIQHVKKLNIIHPYGHLGHLPESRSGVDQKFALQNPESIVDMARHIRTFTEDLVDHSLRESVIKAFDETPMVVSLGFGYQTANIGLMNASNTRGRHFVGTTYGMSSSNASTGPKNLMNILNAVPFDPWSVLNLKADELLQSLQLALFK